MATSSGTWGYRDRFGDRFGRTYFRRFGPGVVSSVGAGTYLGDPTDAVDDRYRAALAAALANGINLVDAASNYRCGRSERVVGAALDESGVDRESVVLASKAGFLPFDGERPADPSRYVRETFLDTGLVDAADLAHGSHCIAPDFLDAMLDRSLAAVGVDRLDCYYVHNPETQLAVRDREAVYDRLEAAFETLERRRAAGASAPTASRRGRRSACRATTTPTSIWRRCSPAPRRPPRRSGTTPPTTASGRSNSRSTSGWPTRSPWPHTTPTPPTAR